MKLHAFMMTPALAGTEFRADSWAAWRCVARLIDGDARLLTQDEQKLVLRLTGRTALPTIAPDELAVGAGRRSGKSRFCGVMAAWFAAQDYRDRMSPGETAAIALAAPDRKQAALLLDYVRAILEGSDLLRAEIGNQTADSIELKHGTKIEVVTSNYRSIRGRTICAAVLDECSFLRSDDSANPDVELYRALLPSMITLSGPLIAISSPHMRRGLLYSLYARYFGNDSARGLYLQSDSLTLNPSLNRETIDRAMQDDPESGRSEWGGEYRSDLAAYLPAEDIDKAVIQNRRLLAFSYHYQYRAFCDPSGGRSDSMTLGISHLEDGKVVLDKLVAVTPPFDPETTVIRFCEVLGAYGLNRVTGDQYGGDWIATSFARHGVAYTPSELTASEIYVEAAPLFSQGLVELLDIQALRTELSLLERKPRPGGRGDSVDHPRNAHDDQAIAALGSLLLASATLTGGPQYAGAVTHAVTDYDVLAPDYEAPTRQPRHLPPGFAGIYEDDFSKASRSYDPLSRP